MTAQLDSWTYYKEVLGSPKYVVAPMVDQSELPFRLLCRRYGAQLAYTPMLHAENFSRDHTYRKNYFTTCPEDRPLVVQFCANKPETLLTAARLVENSCEAVDINLGCPQNVAKRGMYGAFLSDYPEIVRSLVSVLHENLSVPVFCKIRILPTFEQTLAYASMIQDAGCQLLTIHGRTREQKGQFQGLADWDMIRRVRERLHIPVFANGNIQEFSDIQRCLDYTGAVGVMSAEGVLANPALFSGTRPDPCALAYEYLELAEKYGAWMINIRSHIFKILGESIFQRWEDLRRRLSRVNTLAQTRQVVDKVARRRKANAPPVKLEMNIKPPKPEPLDDITDSSTALFGEEEEKQQQQHDAPTETEENRRMVQFANTDNSNVFL